MKVEQSLKPVERMIQEEGGRLKYRESGVG